MASDLSRIFDEWADRYEPFVASRHHQKLKRELMRRICATLPRGSSIVDVGCGPGAFAISLAQKGYDVIAVDISPRMLERLRETARREGVSVESICVDASAGLSGVRTVDAAISVHGPLSYSADPTPLAAEIASRVRKGGHLWFGLPRAAALEQIARDPRRALRPFLHGMATDPYTSPEGLELFIHESRALAKALEDCMEVRELFASGVALNVPDTVDRVLGRLPLLRRLGGTTVVHGVAR